MCIGAVYHCRGHGCRRSPGGLRGLQARKEAVRQPHLHPESSVHKEVPHGDITQGDPLGVAVGEEGEELEEDHLGLGHGVLHHGRAVRDQIKHSESQVRVDEVEHPVRFQYDFGFEEVGMAGGGSGGVGTMGAVPSVTSGAIRLKLFDSDAVETLDNVTNDNRLWRTME